MIAMLDLLWRGVGVLYTSDREREVAQRIASSILSIGVPVVVGRVRDFDLDRVWPCYDAFIFISPVSAAVRLVCGRLTHKSRDPPVVVVDPGATYAVPIVGAHWGGNEIAQELSKLLNLHPVITTASELYSVLSVEQIARLLHCSIENIEEASVFDQALISGERVCVYGVDSLPASATSGYVVGGGRECRYAVVVYPSSVEIPSTDGVRILRCKRYRVSIGVGCHSNVDPEHIVEVVRSVIKSLGIEISMISCIASVKAVVGRAAKSLGLQFKLLSMDELSGVDSDCLSPPSPGVLKYGVKGVAELAALYGCGGRAQLIFRKRVFDRGVTVAVAGCGD